MINPYKIGIELAVAGNFSTAINSLMGSMVGLNSKTKELAKNWNLVGLAIKGAATAFAGIELAKGIGNIIDKGAELIHQQNLLKTAFGNTADAAEKVAKATAAAYAISRQVPTTTPAENLKAIGELRYATGHLDTALAVAPSAIALNANIRNLTGHDESDQVYQAIKLAEQSGRIKSIPETLAFLDQMQKVASATRGKVDPNSLFLAGKYGREALLGWNDQFMSGALPRLVQSMGGGGSGGGGGGGRAGPGNALMTAFQYAVAHAMNKKTSEFWGSMGMFDQSGNTIGQSMFINNPYEWVQQYLGPQLTKQGYKKLPENLTDEQIQQMFNSDQSFGVAQKRDDLIGVISRLFPTRTAAQVITEMLLQGRYEQGSGSLFEKDIGQKNQALGIQDTQKLLMSQDWQMNVQAFNKQWDALIQSLGAPLVGQAAKALKTMTGAFTSISQFASQHPTATKIVGDGLVALAAGLTVLGASAVIAALTPLIGAGGIIAGVAAALGTLAAIKWQTIKQGFEWIGDAITGLWNKLKSLFGSDPNHWNANPVPGAMNYMGGGSYYPASYEQTSSGGGSQYSPGGGAPSGSRPGSSGNVASAPMGNLPNLGNLGSGGPGIINRSRFAAEIAKNPALMNRLIAVGANEDYPSSPSGRLAFQAVLESAMNRASERGTSLASQLRWTSEGGYYAGHPHWQIIGDKKNYAAALAIAKQVLGGSDITRGATDNSSQGLAEREALTGHFIRHMKIHGESFFHPGSAEPALAAKWGHWYESQRAKGNGVPPPSANGDVHVHNHVNLDGKPIAKSVTKHQTNMGNGPTGGTRLSDTLLTRPLSI